MVVLSPAFLAKLRFYYTLYLSQTMVSPLYQGLRYCKMWLYFEDTFCINANYGYRKQFKAMNK